MTKTRHDAFAIIFQKENFDLYDNNNVWKKCLIDERKKKNLFNRNK